MHCQVSAGLNLFSRPDASAVFAAAFQVLASTTAQTWDFSAGEAWAHLLWVVCPRSPLPSGGCGAECAPALTPIDSLSLMLPEYSVADSQAEMWMWRFSSESIALLFLSSLNSEASRASLPWPLCETSHGKGSICWVWGWWCAVVHFSCLLGARWGPGKMSYSY